MEIFRIQIENKGSWLIMLEDVNASFSPLTFFITPKKKNYKITVAFVNLSNEGSLVSSNLLIEMIQELDKTYKSDYENKLKKNLLERNELVFSKLDKPYVDLFVSRLYVYLSSFVYT
jgi:hypothetical protein